MKYAFIFIASLLLFSCSDSIEIPQEITALEDSLPEEIDYNIHVKPILSDRCFKCHGPDKNKVEAGLQLTDAELASAKLKSGKRAIVAGDIDESELIKRILSHDPEEVMPTPKSNLSLDNKEKATLIKWIRQGAEYKELWSLNPIEKPDVPKIGTFFSRMGWSRHWETDWAKNEIDNFVLEKLRTTKLQPNNEADKTTLLRRVSLDLTGLPPTIAEINAFRNDKSADAYEKAVDRLLKSPHYGERMAVDWLDVARYADTHGYQFDVLRTAYPYRDWVINSFNQNLSFDKFITYQLAGDLLPKPTRNELIATAFNRMHMQNQEGGIVEDEYRAEYVADRVNTFGKAFLGLTVECARCHDHKYDPISTKDYYSLSAFFNNINEAGQVPALGESSPTIILTSKETDKKLAAIKQKILSLKKSPIVKVAPVVEKDKNGALKDTSLIAHFTFDEALRDSFKNEVNPKKYATVKGEDPTQLPEIVQGKFGLGRICNGMGVFDLGKNIAYFERHQPFSVSIWLNIAKNGIKGPVFARSNGLDNGNRGYECILNSDRTLNFNLNHSYPDNSIDIQTVQPLPFKKWFHLTVTYDGLGEANGARIFIDGKQVATRTLADNLKKSIIYGYGKTIGFGILLNFQIGGKFRDSMKDFYFDELRIYNRDLATNEVSALAKNQVITPNYFENQASKNKILQLKAQETALYDACEEVMVMKERAFAKKTFVLKRGAYDAKGEEVLHNTPYKLPKFSEKYPKNRLGLAQWLLDEENPLFTRVIVNRFWQQFFGRGLVNTVDDFGNQGELPTHPELLDWLAAQFREDGFDTKKLIKRIVMSATYRQSSVNRYQNNEINDVENRFLARQSSYRLSAEIVRDNALAASGLLNRKIGGPSVHPYQPDGVWESLSNYMRYKQNHGDTLYRRSMYTILKRTAPHPAMINFDAPDRQLCTVKRQKTNTPLQALVTLNDVQFVEAARVLAEKTIKINPADKISYLFETIISRKPRKSEYELMKQLLVEQSQHFIQNPNEAKELLSVGEYKSNHPLNEIEVASLAIVSQTIMNYDEAIIRR